MEITSLRRWFREPIVLLAIASGLIAFAVQSGELGTADTQHREQSAHSFWTSEPPVFPNEYPEFGVHGRNGKLQSWYGIGQSLLMLPADVVGSYLERLTIFAGYSGTDPTVRNIIVSYTTNILVTVLTALACFRFLRQLNFDVRQAVAGVLVLLVATTHLHYTQNMMENNYIFLLTLAGISYQYEWVLTASRRALLIGSGALGLNLLTRLTTGLDLLAAGFFVLLLLWLEGTSKTELWQRCKTYAITAAPVYALFLFLDRLYQYHRFGSFFNTYVTYFALEARQRDPSLSIKYPFEKPFHEGFFGALFTPEKSIFLFDPLLIVMIVLTIVAWKRFSPAVKAYVVSAFALLLAYICFYARYTVWSGDFAWGDRYVSTSVELAVLLAIPLLLRHRREVGGFVWALGMTLLAISTAIQIASLCFWLPLEIYQMESLGHPTLVIALRFRNIVNFAMGRMYDNFAMHWDPWDYVHITTWNFTPFLLRRVGVAPAWAVHVAFFVWSFSLAALAAVSWRLSRLLAAHEYD